MACQPGYIEDDSGNCVIDPSAQQITCWDGSLASTYDQCPDIGDAWDPVEGIGIGAGEGGGLGEGVFGDDWVAPAWWDDPTTTDTDEWKEYIYTAVGGEAGTKMGLEDFWSKYGGDFPTWEESGFAAKYENVLEQLGMLNTSIRLASEDFNLDLDKLGLQKHATIETALTQKEDIGTQMESQFVGSGGVVSGRRIETAEAASENVTQALGLEFRGIDISRDLLETSYEGELINIESRKINYESELIGLEDQFEQHLINFLDMMHIEPGNGSDIDDIDAENMAIVMACEENCNEQGNPPGCRALCRPDVDDIDYGEEDDLVTYVPDDPVITKQGCIDECVDEGGNEAACRQSCFKGSTDKDTINTSDCVADCMADGTIKLECLEICGA